MKRIDLHIHTLSSDGLNTKEEIINKACELGLDMISITDHDVLNTEYLEDKRIKVIPGIELSATAPIGIYHILGLFFKDNCDFRYILEASDKNRNAVTQLREDVDNKLINEFSKKQLVDLNEYNSFKNNRNPLKGEQYKFNARDYVIEKGLCKDINDYWDRLIPEIFPNGHGCTFSGYVSAKEAIEAIRKSGGIAIMAHPTERLVDFGVSLDDTIKAGTELGIDGYECIHYSASEEKRKILIDWCRNNNMYITCGSDYHGGKAGIKFGYSDEEYSCTKIPMLNKEI
ncbi:MAG: PHP domain-containing protein [Candidatus Delongbacteria bacterium]|jgi:predicted metal-dependent phosphoesterase TrpH|nr:PHP domain-containing protein [Candidatus Delongbacteria bacterium]